MRNVFESHYCIKVAGHVMSQIRHGLRTQTHRRRAMWNKKFCAGTGCAVLLLVICVGFIVIVYLDSEEEDPALEVFLKQGALKGRYITTRKGRHILGFQRIPYATPPIGDLRFRVRRVLFVHFL